MMTGIAMSVGEWATLLFNALILAFLIHKL